jgi:sugar lactone lactonase YvrE
MAPSASGKGAAGLVCVLLLFAPLWACSGEILPTEPDECAGSAPGRTHLLTDSFEGTEGLAFSPDGRLFVSEDHRVIAEVFPDGSWAEIAVVPGAIGLAWWGSELLVASSEAGEGSSGDAVFAVDVDSAAVRLIGGGLVGANFVTVTPWGTLLISDPSESGLLEMTADGEVSTWLADLPSPNGTALSPAGDMLWAVATYTDPAPVWQIPIGGDGAAGPSSEVAAFTSGTAPDGVAVGRSGDLYIAQNIAGSVDRVAEDGRVTELSPQTPWAASLAFGEGPDWDRCSLYVTSLFSGELYRVEAGELGLPTVR